MLDRNEIYSIGSTAKLFDLQEALSLLPLIQTITRKHDQQLRPIRDRLTKMLSNDPRRQSIEREYEVVVLRWRSKIERLGLQASGLWCVGFDVGGGMVSWRYPELTLSHYIKMGDVFDQRVNLSNYIDEHDPDWAH